MRVAAIVKRPEKKKEAFETYFLNLNQANTIAKEDLMNAYLRAKEDTYKPPQYIVHPDIYDDWKTIQKDYTWDYTYLRPHDIHIAYGDITT